MFLLAWAWGCAATAQLHAGPLAVRENLPEAPIEPEGLVGAEMTVSISDHIGFGMMTMARAGEGGGSLAAGLELCGVSTPTRAGFVLVCLGDHLADVGYRDDEVSLAIGSPVGHLAWAMRVGNTLMFLNLWGGWDAQLRGGPSRGWAGLSVGVGSGWNAYGAGRR